MRKIVSLMTVMTMLISFSIGVYADEGILNKSMNVEEKVLYSLREIDKEYKVKNSDAFVKIDFEKIAELDEEKQEKILEFIDEYGIDYVMELVQNSANELQIIDSVNETINTYEYYITDEDLDENNEVDISNLDPSNMRSNDRSYDKEQYHKITFPKNFTIEYVAQLGLRLRVANGKFDYVSGNSFDVIGMSAGGSYTENDRTFTFNNARTSCSYNVHYTAEFGYDIPIFDFGIPVYYSQPVSDYLIAYY